MTIILIILASAYTAIHDASKWAFIVLYAATFFFANFGPNATTFITPVEVGKPHRLLHRARVATPGLVGCKRCSELLLSTAVDPAAEHASVLRLLLVLCS